MDNQSSSVIKEAGKERQAAARGKREGGRTGARGVEKELVNKYMAGGVQKGKGFERYYQREVEARRKKVVEREEE